MNAVEFVLTPAQVERFHSQVGPPDANGCRRWLLSLDAHGYGQFKVGRRDVKAHRVAYTIAHGSMPPELDTDHTCRNTWCVADEHLEAVTLQENNRRIAERSTTCRRGHPWAGNRPLERLDGRECRICRNEGKRARYRANPGAVLDYQRQRRAA